jgi:hypothetical protein
MYINNNDALINNYYERLPDLIWPFRIPMGMRPHSGLPILVYNLTKKPYNNPCINVG